MLRRHLSPYEVASRGLYDSWELPEAQRGSHDHVVHDPDGEVAKRMVTERVASGLPIDYQFLSDQHDFGEGRLSSVHQSMPWRVDTIRGAAHGGRSA